jgi:hypothetical protein
MGTEAVAYAAYDTHWRVFIDGLDERPVGYCIGTGPEVSFDVDPEAATRALKAGWLDGDRGMDTRRAGRRGQYVALVVLTL